MLPKLCWPTKASREKRHIICAFADENERVSQSHLAIQKCSSTLSPMTQVANFLDRLSPMSIPAYNYYCSYGFKSTRRDLWNRPSGSGGLGVLSSFGTK